VGEEPLVRRRERTAFDIPEGVTEEDWGDDSVVLRSPWTGVPDRTPCEVRLVAEGVATLGEEERGYGRGRGESADE